MEGMDTRAAAIAEEARRTGQAAEQQKANVSSMATEAIEAEQRAKQMEQELARARGLAAEK